MKVLKKVTALVIAAAEYGQAVQLQSEKYLDELATHLRNDVAEIVKSTTTMD